MLGEMHAVEASKQKLSNLIKSVCLLLLLPLVQYDNRADDLTKQGMLKGIEQAAAFILFLSTGVLERAYCQLEIRHAIKLQKPMVLLHGEKRWNIGALIII